MEETVKRTVSLVLLSCRVEDSSCCILVVYREFREALVQMNLSMVSCRKESIVPTALDGWNHTSKTPCCGVCGVAVAVAAVLVVPLVDRMESSIRMEVAEVLGLGIHYASAVTDVVAMALDRTRLVPFPVHRGRQISSDGTEP